jgi:uncharacterized protein (TIGR02145 family)
MKKTREFWLYPLILSGMVFLLTHGCKKDEKDHSIVKDIDGNVYHTLTIGTKVWMVENLKTTRYRNGDLIPNVTDAYQWDAFTTGAYCNYDNDVVIGGKYGRLYNWYAVADSRNIAPVGWHVATDDDWTALENYISGNIGNSGSVAKALASQTEWRISAYVGSPGYEPLLNNSSGYTALPGGSRNNNGSFNPLGYLGYWWTATELSSSLTFNRVLVYDYAQVYRVVNYKDYGFSVRCVRDN